MTLGTFGVKPVKDFVQRLIGDARGRCPSITTNIRFSRRRAQTRMASPSSQNEIALVIRLTNTCASRASSPLNNDRLTWQIRNEFDAFTGSFFRRDTD